MDEDTLGAIILTVLVLTIVMPILYILFDIRDNVEKTFILLNKTIGDRND
ncbi:MAG: hypothetical protein R3321_11430 [Nitrososphaeraceae archaeon]|nr:hypothetical protein [Nitrososphaeraceae archaeon]